MELLYSGIMWHMYERICVVSCIDRRTSMTALLLLVPSQNVSDNLPWQWKSPKAFEELGTWRTLRFIRAVKTVRIVRIFRYVVALSMPAMNLAKFAFRISFFGWGNMSDVGCFSMAMLAMPQYSFLLFPNQQTSNMVSRITVHSGRNLGSVNCGHNVFLVVDFGLVPLLNASMLAGGGAHHANFSKCSEQKRDRKLKVATFQFPWHTCVNNLQSWFGGKCIFNSQFKAQRRDLVISICVQQEFNSTNLP